MKPPLIPALILCMTSLGGAEEDTNKPPTGDAAQEQAKALGQDGPTRGKRNTHPDAQWFPEVGLGLFIHWGIAAIQAKGDLSWCMLAERPWFDGQATPNEYYGSIKDWHADKNDYDNMLGMAKAAGFSYAVMVTKHHDGFTFWPSAYGDLGTKSTFGGRDFVKEFVTACRKHGLKVGLYFSPPDWWYERQYRSWAFSGPSLDMDHKPNQPLRQPADHEKKRREMVHCQVTELLTNYGDIDLIFFDGGKGECISNDEVRHLQPRIVINPRNGGGGDYGNSEGKLPDKIFTGWFEANLPCWPKLKWSYRDENEYGGHDAPTVLTMLVRMRAWKGNLLANVGPKADGSLPNSATLCWQDMAKWMKHSRESVVDIKAGPWPTDVNLPVTIRDEKTAYVHFLPRLPEEILDIPEGQKKKYRLINKVIPTIREYTDTAIWKKAPVPVRASLLRTGENVSFQYEADTLTITLPPSLRTNTVDVVKVEFAKK